MTLIAYILSKFFLTKKIPIFFTLQGILPIQQEKIRFMSIVLRIWGIHGALHIRNIRALIAVL